MGTVVGNIGSTTTATVTNTSSTNNGLSLNFGSGVHVVRVPGNVTLSGGNTVGRPGLTLSGTGKAIVLQEGGTITGGPGNTSNNYVGSGGQGATALVSNITTKVIKTYGNIVGGSGGGGGPGRGEVELYPNQPRRYDFPNFNSGLIKKHYLSTDALQNDVPASVSALTSTVYGYWNAFADSFTSTLNWIIFTNNPEVSNGNIVPATNGNNGTAGNPRGPGQTGNSGNPGNNGNPGYSNNPSISDNFIYTYKANKARGNYGANLDYYYWHTYDIIKYPGSDPSSPTTSLAKPSWTMTERDGYSNYYNQPNGPITFITNFHTLIFDSNGNRVAINPLYETYNTVKLNATAGGPGGNPGNAYNTTNVSTPFG